MTKATKKATLQLDITESCRKGNIRAERIAARYAIMQAAEIGLVRLGPQQARDLADIVTYAISAYHIESGKHNS